MQRGRAGDGHGGVACFHWCRLRSLETAVVGQRSVTLAAQGSDASDSMGTGHDGLVVCGRQPVIGMEGSTSHRAT